MQKIVEEFNRAKSAHKKQMPIYARLLDTQSELGELSKEYLKASKYGTVDFSMNEKFKDEFGDTLYCLLSLACEANLDAKECLQMAIEKYRKRIEQKNSMGSGAV